MMKITFMGAGSTVFVKNVIGDIMMKEALRDSEIALYDINKSRLQESLQMLESLNHHLNQDRLKLKAYLGVEKRKAALKGAAFVINAIQVGGYKPSTVIDFEIPKKYGLYQTIADSLGIGGIFRAMRTYPVMRDFARDMEQVCPDAWFLNYTNPMCMLTGAMLAGTPIKTVGLCHSVQACVSSLLDTLGIIDDEAMYYAHKSVEKDLGYQGNVAGINHMAWLLSITKNGKDVYPEIRKLGREFVARERAKKNVKDKSRNIIRVEIMNKFGYYVTESSDHSSEYTPYWIKKTHPELIKEFNVPIDEYMKTCVRHLRKWKTQYRELLENPSHRVSIEYAARIIDAVVQDKPNRINANIQNKSFITNLPQDSIVEVPCLVDREGIRGCHIGALPTQCAALNQTNINVQNLAIEGILTQNRERIYQAAMLDPHCAAELTLDEIVAMCDDLFEAHGNMLPEYK